MIQTKGLILGSSPLVLNRRNPTLGGCVLWLPLYKMPGDTIKSRDGIGHSCTVTGATWTLQGRDFNPATPDLISATISELNFTSEAFSGLAWIYVDTFGGINRALINRGRTNNNGWEWHVYNEGRQLFYTNQAAASQLTYEANGTIVPGGWYHVAFVRSGASVTLYNNGVDSTDTAGTHVNPLTNNRTTYIGVAWDGASFPWDGKIGELLIYSRALTVAEIRHHYQATKWRY